MSRSQARRLFLDSKPFDLSVRARGSQMSQGAARRLVAQIRQQFLNGELTDLDAAIASVREARGRLVPGSTWQAVAADLLVELLRAHGA